MFQVVTPMFAATSVAQADSALLRLGGWVGRSCLVVGLKGNQRGWFMGVIPSFPAENQFKVSRLADRVWFVPLVFVSGPVS